MAGNYAYNTRDIKFGLKEWLPVEDIFTYDKFKDYYTKDDLDMLIDQVHKMSAEMIAPTNDDGENTPVYFENGQVHVPASFRKLYKYIQENGWGSTNVDKEAEGTIPYTVYLPLTEMMSAANPAFFAYVGLTNGAAGLLQSFGTEKLREMFLPKLMDGSWAGTMCLTEPTAGTDVGDILSKAYPTDDPEIYKIKGSKIFITGGDGDHVDNIVHLFLARIDGARPGVKGISLFVVPKYWVNEDGSLEPNDVETTGVEHKMGLKGSSTAALSFGDNNNCRGWLLGSYDAEKGLGQGMAQMFQMMNEERVNTGVLALAVTANAYWNAVVYTGERIQGRLMTNPKAGRTQIINHEDVKRMLLLNKATTEACRAILLKTAYYIDISRYDPDPERRKWAAGMAHCLTPIAKAYTSDEAWTLIGESIQAYGGYGYCEEYPVAQAARDSKIYSIWEGTNYIQSIDLLGRKWTMGKGAVFAGLLKEVASFIKKNKESAPGFLKEFANLEKALRSYINIQKLIAGYMANNQAGLIPAFSRRILTASGQLLGGYYLLEQALLAQKQMDELGSEHFDYKFYLGKVISARYFLNNIVPNVWLVEELVTSADSSVIDASPDIFQY
jgi:alkylation response protein AidB-like acyl-CoA dehydrogenase